VLRDLWKRITGREKEAELASDWQAMTPEERAFENESVDDRAAELESEAHLGGFNPEREFEEE